jgi:hypothetical protein
MEKGPIRQSFRKAQNSARRYGSREKPYGRGHPDFGRDHAQPQGSSRVAAAAVLLKKTLPDLAAVEHKGELVQSFVIRAPEVAPTVEAWQATLLEAPKSEH